MALWEIIEHLQNDVLEYVNVYGPQIVVCLIYDSIIDLCKMEVLFNIASMMIGITYILSYDIEKFKVLATFIGISLCIVLIGKLIEELSRYRTSTALYLATIVFCTLHLLKIGENRYLLLLAFMNFLAYTVHINSIQHDEFTSYFSWHFLGYMFNPTNVLFGPWLPVDMYDRIYLYKQRAIYRSLKRWNLERLWSILKYLTTSFGFYIAGRYKIDLVDLIWLMGYGKCLQHRFLHYAKCNLCSAAMTCIGHHNYFLDKKFPITAPLKIEFPISLATALESFDKQLTSFVSYQYYMGRLDYMRAIYSRTDLITLPLIYILITCDQFTPVIAFLTSLIFIHAQANCQAALADAYSICIRRYPCFRTNCAHCYKKNHWVTLASKLIFIVLNVIVINYIYLVFISDDDKNVWKEMKYIGHHIFTAYFLIGIIIMDLNPQIIRLDRRYLNYFERTLTSAGYQQMVDKVTETDKLTTSLENTQEERSKKKNKRK